MASKKEIENIKVEYRPVEPDTLLSIQDLHVWFELRRFGFGHAGYVRAVDGVSFDLKRRETVAVVGESGCGKSSLMKTILGINIPTKGELFFDGQPMTGFSKVECAIIALMLGIPARSLRRPGTIHVDSKNHGRTAAHSRHQG